MKYQMAGLVIDIEARWPMTVNMCRPYRTDDSRQADITVRVTDEDIAAEMAGDLPCTEEYAENLSVYRQICARLPEFDGFLLHAAALAVENKAYLFSAVSGTGKTTHVLQWEKLLGDKVTVVNGDKPIVRRIDGVYCVCGTPWAGKEGWNTPVDVPVAGLCKLTRSKDNFIRPVSSGEILPLLLNQTVRPEDPAQMVRLLDLLDGFVRQVPSYVLGCNISVEAAKVAYEGMKQ